MVHCDHMKVFALVYGDSCMMSVSDVLHSSWKQLVYGDSLFHLELCILVPIQELSVYC